MATAFIDGRLPKPSSLLLGSSGGGRGAGYTPGPAMMVQVQPESNAARAGGATGGSDGGGNGGGDGGEPGKGGAAHSSALVSGNHARRGRAGSGAKENQERRAKLLADLGDGTVLVSWANTGVEEVRAAGPPFAVSVQCRQPRDQVTDSFRPRVQQQPARLGVLSALLTPH